MKKSAKSAPAAKAITKPAAKKTVAKSAPKPAPARKPSAPVLKKAPAAEPATFISAQIDIGFGNHLYLRGEGPGLSWDAGLAMDNTGTNLWTTAIKGAKLPVVFKVLVNDLTWSTGADYRVDAGKSITIHPTF